MSRLAATTIFIAAVAFVFTRIIPAPEECNGSGMCVVAGGKAFYSADAQFLRCEAQ